MLLLLLFFFFFYYFFFFVHILKKPNSLNIWIYVLSRIISDRKKMTHNSDEQEIRQRTHVRFSWQGEKAVLLFRDSKLHFVLFRMMI
jgi:hypothetical protein